MGEVTDKVFSVAVIRRVALRSEFFTLTTAKMAQDKSADYFQHDADMRNDVKVKALRRRFSHKGYAVWCYILETLVDCDFYGIGFRDLDRELLAADFDVTVDELRAIVDYCCTLGLLQLQGDRLCCDNLVRRFAALEELRDKRSKAGKAGMAKRWGKLYHSDNTVITPDNKVEKSIVEESREKDNNTPLIVPPKNSSTRFVPPTEDEVAAYCKERGNDINARHFIDYYEARGWMLNNKTKMKSWKAAVRTWENRQGGNTNSNLGAGEYIEQETGRRTYGSGRYTIPPTAPARPSEQHFWDAETQAWIVI